jgi:hypothetical protein
VIQLAKKTGRPAGEPYADDHACLALLAQETVASTGAVGSGRVVLSQTAGEAGWLRVLPALRTASVGEPVRTCDPVWLQGVNSGLWLHVDGHGARLHGGCSSGRRLSEGYGVVVSGLPSHGTGLRICPFRHVDKIGTGSAAAGGSSGPQPHQLTGVVLHGGDAMMLRAREVDGAPFLQTDAEAAFQTPCAAAASYASDDDESAVDDEGSRAYASAYDSDGSDMGERGDGPAEPQHSDEALSSGSIRQLLKEKAQVDSTNGTRIVYNSQRRTSKCAPLRTDRANAHTHGASGRAHTRKIARRTTSSVLTCYDRKFDAGALRTAPPTAQHARPFAVDGVRVFCAPGTPPTCSKQSRATTGGRGRRSRSCRPRRM